MKLESHHLRELLHAAVCSPSASPSAHHGLSVGFMQKFQGEKKRHAWRTRALG